MHADDVNSFWSRGILRHSFPSIRIEQRQIESLAVDQVHQFYCLPNFLGDDHGI